MRKMPKMLDTTSTLLHLIQEVAYSDGSMSAKEEHLIADLIQLHQLEEDRDSLIERSIENFNNQAEYRSVARGSAHRLSRLELLSRLEQLETQADRELAVSLSYLTICIDQNQEDHFSINKAEQYFYTDIVKASGLRTATVLRLQEEAKDFLNNWSQPSIIVVIRRLFTT